MAATVHPQPIPIADPKNDMSEMRHLLDVLKMRLFLIKSQAVSTHGQIVVMEDRMREEYVRRRTAVAPQSQHLRSAPPAPPTPPTHPPVSRSPIRRCSKRAFAQAQAKIVAKKKCEDGVAKKEKSEDANCPVCLLDIPDNELTETSCGHAFHGQCIDRWAAETYSSPKCPVCRHMLFVPD